MASSERPAVSGELCTCGRQAIVVLVTEDFGEVGWCGLSGVMPPVTPCPFCGSEGFHRTAWGDIEKCPKYRVSPNERG
jgi:hypothetical protein